MYNKIIFGKMRHPMEIHYCPGCGSDNLEGSTSMDYQRDDEYYLISSLMVLRLTFKVSAISTADLLSSKCKW